MMDIFRSDFKKLLNDGPHYNNYDWIVKFYNAIEKEELYINNYKSVYGPDNLPYLQLYVGKGKVKITLPELANKCIEQGLGVVLFYKNLNNPYWVFSCGDMVSLRGFGKILVERGIKENEEIIIKERTEVTVGEPNEYFLPKTIRSILREDIKNFLNISEPKVILMYCPQMQPKYSMVFNIVKTDYFSDEEKYNYVMHRITWHLPRHCPATSFININQEYFPI